MKLPLTMSQAKLANQQTAGLTPLTNCRCLALLTLSWMRKRTKLAGMKDMAKITQMDTTTSVEVVALQFKRQDNKHKVDQRGECAGEKRLHSACLLLSTLSIKGCKNLCGFNIHYIRIHSKILNFKQFYSLITYSYVSENLSMFTKSQL